MGIKQRKSCTKNSDLAGMDWPCLEARSVNCAGGAASIACVEWVGVTNRSGFICGRLTQGFAPKSGAAPWAGIAPRLQRGNSGASQRGWEWAYGPFVGRHLLVYPCSGARIPDSGRHRMEEL